METEEVSSAAVKKMQLVSNQETEEEGKEGGSEAGRRKGRPLEWSRRGESAYREGANSSGQQFAVEFGRLSVTTDCD